MLDASSPLDQPNSKGFGGRVSVRVAAFLSFTLLVYYLNANTTNNESTTDNFNINNSTTGEEVMRNKLCQRGDIRQGKWIDRGNVTGAIGGGSELAEPDTYRWVPRGADANANTNVTSANYESTCHYQEDFNSTLFCNLMQNAVIMFIGDSILW